MHPLSAETSHKRLESPFKPSPPYTLMESNTEGERELNLGEFMDIKLIGMAIEYERGGIHHLVRAVSSHKAGKEPVISSSAYRPLLPKPLNRGQRSFQDGTSVRESDPHRVDRPLWDAIPDQADRYDAGIVFKAGFRQSIKSPQCIPDDRKVRRPIPFDFLSSDLLQEVFGAAEVGQEFVGG